MTWPFDSALSSVTARRRIWMEGGTLEPVH
jgi:hypothetical protein